MLGMPLTRVKLLSLVKLKKTFPLDSLSLQDLGDLFTDEGFRFTPNLQAFLHSDALRHGVQVGDVQPLLLRVHRHRGVDDLLLQGWCQSMVTCKWPQAGAVAASNSRLS